MADERERAIERAQKLLRLASPTGGATEAERTSAALEAAKLIAEHGLAVATPPPREKRRRPRPASPPTPTWDPSPWVPSTPTPYPVPPSYAPPDPYLRRSRWSSSDWTEMELAKTSRCGVCGQIMIAGETVWYAEGRGVRHYDITCHEGLR